MMKSFLYPRGPNREARSSGRANGPASEGLLSRRRGHFETAHDVELNGVDIFRGKAEEFHADAVGALFADDASAEAQVGM